MPWVRSLVGEPSRIPAKIQNQANTQRQVAEFDLGTWNTDHLRVRRVLLLLFHEVQSPLLTEGTFPSLGLLSAGFALGPLHFKLLAFAPGHIPVTAAAHPESDPSRAPALSPILTSVCSRTPAHLASPF